jgi:hypothetical protein
VATNELFPAELVVKAIRDNGYKATDYALAELIDNSIQARANDIRVLLREATDLVEHRRRTRVAQIAVVDDGCGMDDDTLRMALQFGNGMNREDPAGIGRFGMGLPTSSLSQCRHVDVYTWTGGGPSAARHSFLDLDEIAASKMREVPAPTASPVPSPWAEVIGQTESGTLVIWSQLDRINWKTAASVVDNTARLVGRLYRYFLPGGGGKTTIHLLALEDGAEAPTTDHHVRVNDPLFLMAPSAAAAPYDEKPLFELFGKPKTFTIAGHDVRVTCARARDEALSSASQPGATPWGKDAARNRGVSVVRADRELDLDTDWNRGDTFRDRFWGVEIAFPPALDDLFGVTNNKQFATKLSQFATLISDPEADEDDWKRDLQEYEDEGDPNADLMRMVQFVRDRIQAMRKELKEIRSGKTKAERHDEGGSEEDIASRKLRKLAEETGPIEVETDDGVVHPDADLPDDEAEALVKGLLEDGGATAADAEATAKAFVKRGHKVIFNWVDSESDAFFLPRAHEGVYEIQFNRAHPFAARLHEVIEGIQDSDEGEEVLTADERAERASNVIHLLLLSFAREELESREKRKQQLQETRKDWGRSARFFLADEEDLD